MEDNLSFEQLPKAVSELHEKLNKIETLLINQVAQTEKDQLLTIKQTGELLNLSVPTLYGYVSRNEIPFSKKKKRLYFSKMEILDWVKEGRRKTLAETYDGANTLLRKSKN